jgi:hypothetical protein
MLGTLRTACSQLLPACIDKAGAQVAIVIDVHGKGGASVNLRPVNASDEREFVRRSAGGYSADGNHIGITGKTGIANVNIVADDTWIGTRSSAHRSKVITSAILKRPAAYCRVIASISVGLQRERAHSGIVSTVVIIDESGCSEGAVSCARSVE